MVAAFAVPVRAAANFEDAMAEVQKVADKRIGDNAGCNSPA
jgi:hypothetical protein